MAVDYLRRKLTVRAHGQSLVLVKRPIESAEHVLQKALLWALYLPHYPDLRVEVPLPRMTSGHSRYKPDLLALNPQQEPICWGECGEVALEKLRFLLSRYRRTHFVFSKWDTRLDPFAEFISKALPPNRRTAPVELISFPPDAAEWIGADGSITPGSYTIRRWAGQ
jgi:hypothetical protein